jgi:hypothetical protein
MQNAIYLPDGKCDIAAAQLRYDINPHTPAGISHRRYIAPLKRYIANPNGIYIAANKKLPSEEGSFIVSN